MKSPMITEANFLPPEDKGSYSELRVLQSNAGYYIGTVYQNRDQEGNLLYEEPGSRDSDYFPSEKSAAKALKAIEAALPGNDGLYREPQSNIFK